MESMHSDGSYEHGDTTSSTWEPAPVPRAEGASWQRPQALSQHPVVLGEVVLSGAPADLEHESSLNPEEGINDRFVGQVGLGGSKLPLETTSSVTQAENTPLATSPADSFQAQGTSVPKIIVSPPVPSPIAAPERPPVAGVSEFTRTQTAQHAADSYAGEVVDVNGEVDAYEYGSPSELRQTETAPEEEKPQDSTATPQESRVNGDDTPLEQIRESGTQGPVATRDIEETRKKLQNARNNSRRFASKSGSAIGTYLRSWWDAYVAFGAETTEYKLRNVPTRPAHDTAKIKIPFAYTAYGARQTASYTGHIVRNIPTFAHRAVRMSYFPAGLFASYYVLSRSSNNEAPLYQKLGTYLVCGLSFMAGYKINERRDVQHQARSYKALGMMAIAKTGSVVKSAINARKVEESQDKHMETRDNSVSTQEPRTTNRHDEEETIDLAELRESLKA